MVHLNDQVSQNGGIVYVLTNPAMPRLVKIGKTSRESVNARLGELYTTGVPVPFECAYAGRVEDENAVERAFHQAFGPYRVNPKREFFEIEPEQAIALLQLMASEDVTPAIRKEADEVDVGAKESASKLKARRPNLNFPEMGIPIGSTLVLLSNPEVTTEVVGERQVLYKGETTFLTSATKDALGLTYNVAPGPRWTFEGKSVSALFDEAYGPL